MFGLIGTFVNAGAVILGGTIGLLLNKGIPQTRQIHYEDDKVVDSKESY